MPVETGYCAHLYHLEISRYYTSIGEEILETIEMA